MRTAIKLNQKCATVAHVYCESRLTDLHLLQWQNCENIICLLLQTEVKSQPSVVFVHYRPPKKSLRCIGKKFDIKSMKNGRKKNCKKKYDIHYANYNAVFKTLAISINLKEINTVSPELLHQLEC